MGYQRLKVPPSINQFQNSLDKNLSINLFKLLHKYRPEDKQSKKERVQGEAEKKEAGAEEDKKKPISIKFGINHITKLVTAIRQQYNENAKAIERSWGGGIMGVKSQAATQKTEKALAKEMAKKAMM